MCDPVTITMATLAVAQGVSAKQTADATRDAVEGAYANRQDQIDEATAMKNVERARAARRERARIMAMAGESGVGGNSVNLQVMDSRFQEGYDRGNNRTQGLWQKQAARHTAQNQLAKIPSDGAIAMNTGLKIASAGMQGYSGGAQNTSTPGGPDTPAYN